MPRKKIPMPGVRKYGTKTNYSVDTLNEALDKIRSGALSQRQASKEYNIPRSSLNLKLKNKHTKPVGRPQCLTIEEEIIFRDHLLALGDMGIGVSIHDLRDVVKKYLDAAGKSIPTFKNNKPGYEWGKLFLQRHTSVKEKIAHNISRKRAQVNVDMVNQFFDHLEKELEGISPDNIYNMDESGFHDDPGKQKLLFKRSTRHPDLIRNATKLCFTVVCCGNAGGEIIPPFFIFKGHNCWSDWLFNAPKYSKMSVSKSGWIDSNIFEEWLEKHFIPLVEKKDGTKILICDNLSAHVSVKALKLCREHNIKFICLIPNSTHLLQPLDVGYFSAIKTAWRSVLTAWRQTARGRKVVALPKNMFAQLIKKTLEIGQSTAGSNLVTGFRKCGIYPVSRNEVLKILPNYANTNDTITSIGDSFKGFLQELRDSDLNVKPGRKFQLPVVAGKSVSAEEVENYYKAKEDENKKKTLAPPKRGRPVGAKNKLKKKKPNTERELSSPISNQRIIIQAEVYDDDTSVKAVEEKNKQDTDDLEAFVFEEKTEKSGQIPNIEDIAAEEVILSEDTFVHGEQVLGEYIIHDERKLVQISTNEKISVNKYCVFKDEDTLFPGRITSVDNSRVTIKCLTKCFEGGWVWPEKQDTVKISFNNIVKVLNKKQITHNGGIVFVDDDFLSLEWGA